MALLGGLKLAGGILKPAIGLVTTLIGPGLVALAAYEVYARRDEILDYVKADLFGSGTTEKEIKKLVADEHQKTLDYEREGAQQDKAIEDAKAAIARVNSHLDTVIGPGP